MVLESRANWYMLMSTLGKKGINALHELVPKLFQSMLVVI